VLVHINFPNKQITENLDEFKELAISAGANIVAVVSGSRATPDSKYFVGSGKAEEIHEAVVAYQAELVLFNHVLTPAQERNIEKLIQCRVLDRTGLILDIFAQHARSFEGKLQVELAVLKHMSTRLIRGWTHLERQRGGIGLRGGPGETQLEVDRRLIRSKIKRIIARLDTIAKQRAQSRQARKNATVPTIALVGYTNAGKSSLFNWLTGASVYVADQLFATLDPILRRVDVPEVGGVIFADTVGFIRHLPHELIVAFHATLEEVSEADLLLHVVDMHDEDKLIHIEQVNHVLEIIKASTVPCLLVYNKIDLCEPYEAESFLNNKQHTTEPSFDRDEQGHIRRVFISAYKKWGMSNLLLAIGECLAKDIIERQIVLLPEQAKLRAELYTKGVIVSERIDDEGRCHLLLRMPRAELDRLFCV
jgi:GTP-binding protein HflX